MEVSIKATIDDLNQYLQGNVTAQGLIITLEDLLNFLKDSEGISENEKMVNLNEGKKGKSNYMAELAEIDKQSALVALEAKINKLAEMAEAKTNRLNMVNEDENLSELISKQAVKEMHRSIKEIEKLKEKLLKEFTKKGGKMTEVIDEDEEMEEAQMIPDKNEDGTYDMSSVGMKEEIDPERDYEDAMKDDKEEMEEGYSSTTYEEDDIEKFDAKADFIDQIKKNIDNWKEAEPAQVAKEKLPTLHKEEYLRMQKLAGVISEEEYKNRLNEALNKDLKTFGGDLKKFMEEKGLKVELKQGNSQPLYNPIGQNSDFAALNLQDDNLHVIVNDSKIDVLEDIIKRYSLKTLQTLKQTGGWADDPKKKAQSKGEIYLTQELKQGRKGKAFELVISRFDPSTIK